MTAEIHQYHSDERRVNGQRPCLGYLPWTSNHGCGVWGWSAQFMTELYKPFLSIEVIQCLSRQSLRTTGTLDSTFMKNLFGCALRHARSTMVLNYSGLTAQLDPELYQAIPCVTIGGLRLQSLPTSGTTDEECFQDLSYCPLYRGRPNMEMLSGEVRHNLGLRYIRHCCLI